MTTRINGGKRSALLFFQRLALIEEARQSVSRLTMYQEQAIKNSLPLARVLRIHNLRLRAAARVARRNNDARLHKSSQATAARGGSRHR